MACGPCLWFFPVFINMWMIAGFSTTLVLTYNSSSSELPYVSYTGTTGVQRGIFTLVTTVTAILAWFNGILRYKFLTQFSVITKKHPLNMVNFLSLYFVGIISSFGLILAGSFQADTHNIPHNVGSVLCFFGLLMYMLLQTILTFNLKSGDEEDRRLAMSCKWQGIFVWQLVNLVLSFICAVVFVAVNIQHRWNISIFDDNVTQYPRMASISEWVLCFSTAAFFLTFIPNFCRISQFKFDVETIINANNENIELETFPIKEVPLEQYR